MSRENGNLRFFAITATALAIPLSAAAFYILYNRLQSDRNEKKQRKTFYKVKSDTGSRLSLDSEGMTRPSSWNSLGLEQPLVIAMVGLPARGKSYIVKMIIRYLSWTGYEAEVFNVGSYRRKIGLAGADSSFFDFGNKDAQKVREDMAMAVQDFMYQWLHSGDQKRRVAIFDATNTTKERRLALAVKARSMNVSLLFVESICNDQKVLERNYHLKLQNDDYKDMDIETATQDFINRVHAYEKVYETVEDDEDNNNVSYIKLINVGQKVITRNCTGYLPSQVAFYLQNVHIEPRRIFLSLLAENSDSEIATYNQLGGGTKVISDAGKQYTIDLPRYLQYEISVEMPKDGLKDIGLHLLVLTGTSKAHGDTVERLRLLFPNYTTPLLDELRGGDFHGMNREQIKREHPEEFKAREANKLNYRYPGVGGESYLDVIERVRPVIIELERQRRSVVVVCHLAVLRCIFAYFMGTKTELVPYIKFSKHNLYALTPGPFGCTCKEIDVAKEIQHI